MGHKNFNKFFDDTKKESAKFMAEHEGKGPAPAWCYTVAEAGGRDVSELKDMTDEEAYEFVAELLPGGIKVCVCGQQQHLASALMTKLQLTCPDRCTVVISLQ